MSTGPWEAQPSPWREVGNVEAYVVRGEVVAGRWTLLLSDGRRLDIGEVPGAHGVAEVKEVTTPSATWSFSHGFQRLPVVTLYLDGEEVEADVEASTSSVYVTWPSPVAGTAVLT